MGLFDFFKDPDVEKMQLKNDVEGLIKALQHNQTVIREKATKALLSLKDERAINALQEDKKRQEQEKKKKNVELVQMRKQSTPPVTLKDLERINKTFNTMDSKIARAKKEDLFELIQKASRSEATQIILKLVEEVPFQSSRHERLFIDKVKELNDSSLSAQVVKRMHWKLTKYKFDNHDNQIWKMIFCFAGHEYADEFLKHIFSIHSRCEPLPDIFGDYKLLIANVYWGTNIVSGESRSQETWSSAIGDHDTASAAMKKLCLVKTPIANNILRLIATRKDLHYTNSWTDYGSRSESTTGTVGFQWQRDLAIEELQRRGNPSYDTSAYFKDGAWTLQNEES